MPSPDQFHSEFGYMCPTPRFRRAFRVSVIAGVFGALAGSVAVIAFAQRADVERMRTDIASTVGSGVSSTVGMAITAAATAAAPTVAPTNVLPAPGSASCAAQSWPYLDNKCLLGTERSIQTTPKTFATPKAFAAVAPAEAAVSSDPLAEASTGRPSPSAAAPVKKRPKTVQRRERAPERQDANPRSAYVDPMTYEQWRRDGGRYDTGRYYDNGYGREQPRDRRGFFW
jgi:hypothetical protein